ncbi:MAG: hypothetical protein SH820_07680 [Xanthomonadales bacterium]|nr:hypothetical protein [Xanthomonadales bacterium]
MKDLEADTALNMAHAIADLIQAADTEAIRDRTIHDAGWCIVRLLDVVQADHAGRSEIKQQRLQSKPVTLATLP